MVVLLSILEHFESTYCLLEMSTRFSTRPFSNWKVAIGLINHVITVTVPISSNWIFTDSDRVKKVV